MTIRPALVALHRRQHRRQWPARTCPSGLVSDDVFEIGGRHLAQLCRGENSGVRAEDIYKGCRSGSAAVSAIAAQSSGLATSAAKAEALAADLGRDFLGVTDSRLDHQDIQAGLSEAAFAMPRPMPLLAPVTVAVFPFNDLNIPRPALIGLAARSSPVNDARRTLDRFHLQMQRADSRVFSACSAARLH